MPKNWPAGQFSDSDLPLIAAIGSPARLLNRLTRVLGPETAHSPNADDLNTLYWVLLAIAGILVVAINLALVAMVVRFRAARGREPRRLKTRRPPQLGRRGSLRGARRSPDRRRDRLHRERQRRRGIRVGRPPGRGQHNSAAWDQSAVGRRDNPAADRGNRPAVDLALRVSGRHLLLLRAGGAGRHRGGGQARLHRRRPPLVGAGARRQVRRGPGGGELDLVQGRRGGRL